MSVIRWTLFHYACSANAFHGISGMHKRSHLCISYSCLGLFTQVYLTYVTLSFQAQGFDLGCYTVCYMAYRAKIFQMYKSCMSVK
jgi:hypothetical protein